MTTPAPMASMQRESGDRWQVTYSYLGIRQILPAGVIGSTTAK
jgi:hypothetical protein